MKKNEDHLTSYEWLKWLGATVCAAATMTAGVLTWAEAKFVSQDVFTMVVNRLDRIEAKLDTLLDFRN